MDRARMPPSAALVISVVALFVALGGTGYAAFGLQKNSVGTKQLKNGAVTGSKLADGAITAHKVAYQSLTGTQINVATLPTVPTANQANKAIQASNADNATNASNAANAEQLGGLQPQQFQRAIGVAGWASAAGNFTGPSSSFTFAGSADTVTTTAGERVVVSGSAALATTSGTASILLAACIQPSGGGSLTPLPSIGDDERLTVTSTLSSFAISSYGIPSAGTWKVGLCVDDTSATAVNANDYSVGWVEVI